MKSAKTRRYITLATLVLALGVAVYLNWEYARVDIANGQDTVETAQTVSDETMTSAGVQEGLPDKNYGEAQLVSKEANADEFFEQARLTRSQSRDQALDTLQKSLKKAQISDEEKAKLTAELSASVDAMTKESDIENLVRAKGFVDCVAFIDAEKVQITVESESETLSAAEVTQIRDIVLGKVDTAAKNITITEVK